MSHSLGSQKEKGSGYAGQAELEGCIFLNMGEIIYIARERERKGLRSQE